MTREEAIKILQSIYFEAPEVTEALQIAIEALSQPSLSSNLDEAAEKAYKEYDVKTAVKPKEHPVGFLFFDGFKAGAEWMAVQGYTKETQVYANRWTDVDEVIVNLGQGEFGFRAGDKVIIQIRKK